MFWGKKHKSLKVTRLLSSFHDDTITTGYLHPFYLRTLDTFCSSIGAVGNLPHNPEWIGTFSTLIFTALKTWLYFSAFLESGEC